MRRSLFLAGLSCFVALAGAHAASFIDDKSLSDNERYSRCLAMAKSDADNAYELALAWHDAGGGPAAIHCSAVALIQLKHYDAAATKLDLLARERDAGGADMRADLLDQAGNAWLLAGQPENALASFSAAINLGNADSDLLSDRARAHAMVKDWAGADADLTKALAKDQYRADLLVLRGSARHAMGRKADALADFNQALDIDPHYADALVERGAMKAESGDAKGARADWEVILATQPKSPAADEARQRIEQLELSQKKPQTPKKPPPTHH